MDRLCHREIILLSIFPISLSCGICILLCLLGYFFFLVYLFVFYTLQWNFFLLHIQCTYVTQDDLFLQH